MPKKSDPTCTGVDKSVFAWWKIVGEVLLEAVDNRALRNCQKILELSGRNINEIRRQNPTVTVGSIIDQRTKRVFSISSYTSDCTPRLANTTTYLVQVRQKGSVLAVAKARGKLGGKLRSIMLSYESSKM
jgi:hypothetical protein